MPILSSKPPASTSDTQTLVDSVKILSDCCQHRIGCRLQLVHTGQSVRASFLTLQPQGIELQIDDDDELVVFSPQSICCVSFSHQMMFCAFLGELILHRPHPSQSRRIVTTVPRQLMTTNLRQSFRVPVVQLSGLETTLQTTDNRRCQVNVTDIAESGLEVELSAIDHPELTVGSSVVIELRLRGDVVVREGEIRRQSGSRYGISMGAFVNDNDPRQRQAMNAMILSLQQLWLKSRLK